MGARKDNPSIRDFGYIMTTASGDKRFSAQSSMGILLMTPTWKSMMNQFLAEKEKESESKKTAIFIATHIAKNHYFFSMNTVPSYNKFLRHIFEKKFMIDN